jgi:hypothetical protein
MCFPCVRFLKARELILFAMHGTYRVHRSISPFDAHICHIQPIGLWFLGLLGCSCTLLLCRGHVSLSNCISTVSLRCGVSFVLPACSLYIYIPAVIVCQATAMITCRSMARRGSGRRPRTSWIDLSIRSLLFSWICSHSMSCRSIMPMELCTADVHTHDSLMYRPSRNYECCLLRSHPSCLAWYISGRRHRLRDSITKLWIEVREVAVIPWSVARSRLHNTSDWVLLVLC